MQPPPVTLEQAMDLADHASPAPWIASQALKVMRREINVLQTALKEKDEPGLLRLVADIRWACGDDGVRMQPELVQYIGQLTDQAAASQVDRAKVPGGWDIRELDGGFIHVESPQAMAVNLGYLPEGNPTASQLLRLLACELISIERCESGLPECGPVEHWDSEGVPLCTKCWDELQAEDGSQGSTHG